MDPTTSTRQLLHLMRSLSLQLLRQERFGAHSGDVLLMCAVAIGHAEHKPMTALKLGQYVGIPRATAARRLQRLEAMGLVRRGERGRYALTAKASRRIEATGRR